jgi:hypothetical protein
MTLIDYGNNIHKDTVFARPAIFIGSGVGCGTVWYDNPEQARRVLRQWNGVAPSGWTSGFCANCTSNDAVHGTVHLACHDWKNKVASGEITPDGTQGTSRTVDDAE